MISSEIPVEFLRAQSIAIDAKGEDGLDRMAAVGKLAADMKREIDLGGRDLARRAHGAAFDWVRPAASFALTRAVISSSPVIKAALHAKRAS